ncbi:IDEAL domain-containing protein [Paenibacillus aestuarii]|uniref:IDEAL domain-containing protein n=1 Tax=Paenibacillus aestuarii TaxID=516965 RepID=A0ABW0K5J8_9BACL|nr:IDEAL domain-containing protein [Paenibacillus aestuarii]
MKHFNIGDWVQGNTQEGELVHGYIETVDPTRGTVGIHVIASDNEESVGTEVEVRRSLVKRLQDSSSYDKEQLNSLIDLALAARDEVWFMELTTKLFALQPGSKVKEAPMPAGAYMKNRLGFSLGENK